MASHCDIGIQSREVRLEEILARGLISSLDQVVFGLIQKHSNVARHMSDKLHQLRKGSYAPKHCGRSGIEHMVI